MCGIVGRAATHRRVDIEPDILEVLAHRGPDSSGTAHHHTPQASWALGHTRLAIVDLSPAGHQPMTNEDGSLVMVFNGEIYNFAELRAACEAKGHRFRSNSDGEVILHLWEDAGPDSLRRLNGIFAIAIASRVTGEVWLATDPLGVKPVVYSPSNDGELWFASEVETLRTMNAPVGDDDLVALAQFLTFLWVPQPSTPFRNARFLEPGNVLYWFAGSMTIRPYVDLVAEAIDTETMRRPTSTELGQRVRAATRRQMVGDVPVALMASGGIDSSLLWWAAGTDLDRAYTIDWSSDRSTERLAEDTHAVALLARSYGTPVEYIDATGVETETLPPSGDLFADPAFDLTCLIAKKAAAAGHKVLLSGQGGDELFGGYRRHAACAVIEKVRLGRGGARVASALSRLPYGATSVEYMARLARACGTDDLLAAYLQLCSYSSARDRADALGCTEAEVADAVVWEQHRLLFDRLPPTWSLLRRARLLDLCVYLPGLNLAYADRGGMLHGVEIRVPLLDLDLVRWALRLPDHAMVDGRRTKVLARNLAAEVLPDGIAERPKRGFAVPQSSVIPGAETQGDRGFRQSAYFTRATQLLARHLERPVRVA
ncbi:MAG: asparagine synthase (glutamine-hydrolyzing) [Acidimicrobiia bacterium]